MKQLEITVTFDPEKPEEAFTLVKWIRTILTDNKRVKIDEVWKVRILESDLHTIKKELTV